MRKLIKSLLVLTFMSASLMPYARTTDEACWENVVKAISQVESGGNPKAVNGIYAGYLQIAPVLVDECNRINKLNKVDKKYSYADRFSVEKSIEMFHIIRKFYVKDDSVEKMIRLWNGGPGFTIPKTETYFKKVYKVYKQIQEAAD